MRVPRQYLLMACESKGGEEQGCFLLAGDIMGNLVILGGYQALGVESVLAWDVVNYSMFL